MQKYQRCPERDGDGHRCTRKVGHLKSDKPQPHTAFGKIWWSKD